MALVNCVFEKISAFFISRNDFMIINCLLSSVGIKKILNFSTDKTKNGLVIDMILGAEILKHGILEKTPFTHITINVD